MADEDADVRKWIRLLANAAQSGVRIDLAHGSPADPSDCDQWGPERCMPAAALRKTLGRNNLTVDPDGLWIRGACITGDVDLSHIVFDYPLYFVECCFHGNVDMSQATFKQLAFIGTHTHTLLLQGANITGDFIAALRFKMTGCLNAFAARINGNVDLTDATFINPKLPAIVLDQAEIGGSVMAAPSKVTVGGSTVIGPGLDVEGIFTAHSARVGWEVNLSGAKLTNPTGDALVLNAAEIGRGLLVGEGLTAEGVLRGYGVHVGGQLDLSAATLVNPHGEAFVFDRAHISQGLFPGKEPRAGFSVEGVFRAESAHIDGQLNLTGVQVKGHDGVALDLVGIEVNNGLVARHGLTVEGQFKLEKAHIDDLHLLGSNLLGDGDVALSLSGVVVSGDVVLGDGFTAQGAVNAARVQIDGAVNLHQATFNNPDEVALNFHAAQVTDVLRLGDDDHGIDVNGIVNLISAKIGRLATPQNRPPPGTLAATGWEIGDLEGPLRARWCVARRWLKTAPPAEDSVQPWHAIAAVYERNGQPAAGRLMRVAAAIRVTGKAKWPTKVLRIVYLLVVGHGYYPLLAAVWLALIVGFGAIIVDHNRADLAPTNQAAANKAAETQAQQTHEPIPNPITGQTPCSSHPGYPCLEPITYALSSLAPTTGAIAADWNIRSDAHLWLASTFTLLKFAAWALTAILLAGVTGLLRKT